MKEKESNLYKHVLAAMVAASLFLIGGIISAKWGPEGPGNISELIQAP